MVEFRLLLNDVWLKSALRSVMRPYADSTPRITSSSEGPALAGPAAIRAARGTAARTYIRKRVMQTLYIMAIDMTAHGL